MGLGFKMKMVLPIEAGGPGIPGRYMINFDPALNQGSSLFKGIPEGSLLHMNELLVEDENGKPCERVCCTRLYIAGCLDDICGVPTIHELPLGVPQPIVKPGAGGPDPDGATVIYLDKLVDVQTNAPGGAVQVGKLMDIQTN